MLQLTIHTDLKMEPLAYRKTDFEEFCAATISVHQLEAREDWDEIANKAFKHFELEGNRVISLEEPAQVRMRKPPIIVLEISFLTHSRCGWSSEVFIQVMNLD